MDQELIYWIWLSLALSVPSKGAKPLLAAFEGDAGKVYESEHMQLSGLSFLTPGEKKKLQDKNLDKASLIYDYCVGNGVNILTWADAAYPGRLKEIQDPPVLLYYRGTLPDLDRLPVFGIVGTRAMSHYGAQHAFDIAFDLARMGCVTVSGMALGIDGVAAAATLAAGGKTVAVLGCGIDYIYPAAHSTLHAAILEGGGAVVTEFSPFERPAGFHFPIRNRIISGMCRGVIMVEGDRDSGAMITAECAKRQGRDVFALPGKIGDPSQEGPLLLLKNGAFPITCADDIYDRYREEYLAHLHVFDLLPPKTVTVYDVIAAYKVSSTTGIGGGYDPGGRIASERVPMVSQVASGKDGMLTGAVNSLKQAPLLRHIFRPKTPEKKEPERKEQEMPPDLTELETRIYTAIPPDGEVSADQLLLDGVSTADILATLTMLEIKGVITARSGGRYRRA